MDMPMDTAMDTAIAMEPVKSQCIALNVFKYKCQYIRQLPCRPLKQILGKRYNALNNPQKKS